MAQLILVLCTLVGLVMSTALMGIPHLLGLLAPGRWVMIGAVLIVVTVLMRDS